MQRALLGLTTFIIALLYIMNKKLSKFHDCMPLGNSRIVTFQATRSTAKAQIKPPAILSPLCIHQTGTERRLALN